MRVNPCQPWLYPYSKGKTAFSQAKPGFRVKSHHPLFSGGDEKRVLVIS
jgi:hypothetical protein